MGPGSHFAWDKQSVGRDSRDGRASDAHDEAVDERAEITGGVTPLPRRPIHGDELRGRARPDAPGGSAAKPSDADAFEAAGASLAGLRVGPVPA